MFDVSLPIPFLFPLLVVRNVYLKLQEFTLWLNGLTEEQKHAATGFFSVIKRRSEANLDASDHLASSTKKLPDSNSDLYSIPYSEIYRPFLKKASEFLQKAGDLVSSPRYIFQTVSYPYHIKCIHPFDWLSILKYSPTMLSHSLKKLLHSKAEAFLSNEYYESDIAWMDLVTLLCSYMVFQSSVIFLPYKRGQLL